MSENKIERFFNTTGPIRKEKNYSIDPLTRVDLDGILSLIDQEKYFVLHAPRQTGKTSLLIALMNYLNKQGKYKTLYVNIEAAQAARENVSEGMQTILTALAQSSIFYLKDSFFKDNWKQIFAGSVGLFALNEALSQWCQQSEKPVALFIDEVDSLVGDTLISLLRQLRSGYPMRPGMFPQSIILCGVRDVRDYRMHSDKEKAVITGGSAFNIKDRSLRLGNFSPEEIKTLYEQHTKETGQVFHQDVFPLVWEQTEGQPWLVNALAKEVCFEMKAGRDRKNEITVDMMIQAKENLILRRDTHLDQLTDKLKEKRVRGVIEPILASLDEIDRLPDDDVEYVVDLGLIKKKPHLTIANRIYREIIPRQLTYTTQLKITQDGSWYMDRQGRLEMDKLLTAFQDFFRKHFESWVEGFDYAEAGPQLLLQAFLQRIVNAGGRVEREYGLGRQRTDLLVVWPYKTGVQQVVLELKLRYGGLETTIKEGLEQTRVYMDKCGAKQGYLLIFNRSPKASWEEKIFHREKTYKGMKIKIYGM
jgi:DNA polymerase III delta prime subunit